MSASASVADGMQSHRMTLCVHVDSVQSNDLISSISFEGENFTLSFRFHHKSLFYGSV